MAWWMDMAPDFSILIPCFRSAPAIFHCLQSLVDQQTSCSFEILVVESSGDDTAQAIAERFDKVTVIASPTRLFAGAARNLGATRARGRWLIFIDADCTVAKDWLDSITQRARQEKTIYGGVIENGETGSVVARADHLLTFGEFSELKETSDVAFLPSCFLVCSSAFFKEIGGFPADCAAGEDLQFAQRVRARGRFEFLRNLRVHHASRTTFVAFLKHQSHLGFHSAVARRRCALKGSFLARIAWLSPFAFPVRSARVVKRMSREEALRPPLLLYVFLGLMAWSLGFVRGAFFKLALSRAAQSEAAPLDNSYVAAEYV